MTQSIGEFEFKNVDKPMRVYALANEGFPVPKAGTITGKLKIPSSEEEKLEIGKSIAVLPFENNSGNTEQQYFVDGIADEIRSQLLSLNDLKVISRSSCMFFKDKPYNVKEIGKELDVGYVLEGRVQVIPNQIKVSVELSNTRTNKQIWSLPALSKKLEDVFILQNNIAKQVVSELKVALSDKEIRQLNKIPADNHQAYEYFQKGQDLLHRGFGVIDELNQAENNFKKAIEIDPKFSKAYVGLSDTYLEYIFWGRTAPKNVLDKALSASLKALELDSTNGECFGALGAIHFYKFQKIEATNFLNKAIELSPNYLGAHVILAWINIFDGKTEEAVHHFSIAQSLDPLSTKHIGDVGHAYYYSHQYSTGIELMSSMLEKYPGDPWLLWMLGYLYSGLGDFKKAIETYLKRPTGTKTNWMLGYSYAKNGMLDEALEILHIHLKKREKEYVPGYMIATIYIGLDNKEKALDWLEIDYKDGGLGLFLYGLKTDTKFDSIRKENRFENLLSKIF